MNRMPLAHFTGSDFATMGLAILPWMAGGIVFVWLIRRLVKARKANLPLLAPCLAIILMLPPVLAQALRERDSQLVVVRLLTLSAAAALLRFGFLRAQTPSQPGRPIAMLSLTLGIFLLLALWLNLRDF